MIRTETVTLFCCLASEHSTLDGRIDKVGMAPFISHSSLSMGLLIATFRKVAQITQKIRKITGSNILAFKWAVFYPFVML